MLHITTAVNPLIKVDRREITKLPALIISSLFVVRGINGRRALPFAFSGSSLMQKKVTRVGGEGGGLWLGRVGEPLVNVSLKTGDTGAAAKEQGFTIRSDKVLQCSEASPRLACATD